MDEFRVPARNTVEGLTLSEGGGKIEVKTQCHCWVVVKVQTFKMQAPKAAAPADVLVSRRESRIGKER